MSLQQRRQSHLLRGEAFVVTLPVALTYLCCLCFRPWCRRLLGRCAGKPGHLLPKEVPVVLNEELHQPCHLHTANQWFAPGWLKRGQTGAFPDPDPRFCAESCSCGDALPSSSPTSVCGREEAARHL